MTRWSETVELIGITETLNDEGSPIEERIVRKIYCNPFTIGANTWLAARSAGLHADAEIEVRSNEYFGEQAAKYRGIEFEVERVNNTGEFTRLILARRLSNG